MPGRLLRALLPAALLAAALWRGAPRSAFQVPPFCDADCSVDEDCCIGTPPQHSWCVPAGQPCR